MSIEAEAAAGVGRGHAIQIRQLLEADMISDLNQRKMTLKR